MNLPAKYRGLMRDPRRVLLPNPPFPLQAATCRGLRPPTMAVAHFKQVAQGPGLQVCFTGLREGRGPGTHRGQVSSLCRFQKVFSIANFESNFLLVVYTIELWSGFRWGDGWGGERLGMQVPRGEQDVCVDGRARQGQLRICSPGLHRLTRWHLPRACQADRTPERSNRDTQLCMDGSSCQPLRDAGMFNSRQREDLLTATQTRPNPSVLHAGLGGPDSGARSFSPTVFQTSERLTNI